MKRTLKNKLKKVTLASMGAVMATIITLGSVFVCLPNEKIDIDETTSIQQPETSLDKKDVTSSTAHSPYERLLNVRNIKLPTYTQTYKDEDGIKRQYEFASEEDVLNLSREFSVAIEDYLRSCGAGYWTNADTEQFWLNDMEYIVAAMAFRESTYRTNYVNEQGYGGITGFDDVDSLKTLREQWFVEHVWGNNVPDVDCSSEGFDISNPNQCMELTYHYLGYTLATRFKKDKHFNFKGERRCIWDEIDFSEELQTRMVIASYFWGVGNVTNAVFGYPNEKGEVVSLDDYLYSFYVEDVLDKAYELIDVTPFSNRIDFIDDKYVFQGSFLELLCISPIP